MNNIIYSLLSPASCMVQTRPAPANGAIKVVASWLLCYYELSFVKLSQVTCSFVYFCSVHIFSDACLMVTLFFWN